MNWEKCEFHVNEVEFLGHKLTEKGIHPSESKLNSIMSFRRPENEAEVRSFLGLANYLNKFMPNLATLDEPLRALLKKGSKFEWSESHQKAFENIKRAMTEAQALGFFNKCDQTSVMVDASPVGLGAILMQTDQKGESRVVSCASKSLTDTEKRYCQTEKEALAIVWSVERFQAYLYGSTFNILTDCKALEFLFTERSRPCARIERWVLRLQAFDYCVVHIPGDKNLADVLSRLTSLPAVPFDYHEEIFIKNIALCSATTAALKWDDIVQESTKDVEIQQVLGCLENGTSLELPLQYRVVANELCRCEEVLMRTDRIVIPQALQEKVLQIAHEGHIGIRMMKLHLRGSVWWPKMDAAVESFVKRCRGCILVSAPDPPEPMVRKETPNGPWQEIAIDFLGPLPDGQTLLVVVDYYSRYIEVCEMNQTTAKETINQLSTIFSRFGVPLTLRADNGPQFNASCEEFQAFCEDVGVQLINTIPYWPQQNGEVERQNRSILKRLKIAQHLGQDWRKVLSQFLLSYHATAHPTIGRSPSELMFGRKIRTKLPGVPTFTRVNEEHRDHDALQKEKGKEYADLKRKARFSEIKVGDNVLAKRMRKDNKLSTNYAPEEYEVTRKSGADVTIKSLENGKEYRRNVAHLKKLLNGIGESSTTEDSGSIEKTVPSSSSDTQLPTKTSPTSTQPDLQQDKQISVKRNRNVPVKFKDYLSH